MSLTFFRILLLLVFVAAVFCVGCSAQTEEQALASLRQMTAGGKLPPESVVADIEKRFAGKRTGALAKLLHARIKFDSQDFAGTAALLDSDVFAQKTKVADHALWLRAKALQAAGRHGDAMNVFNRLWTEMPSSIRVRDAKLAWAQSAIATGRAVEVPPMLVQMSESKDADAALLTAKAFEAQGSADEAARYYRRAYFFSIPGSPIAKEVEAKFAGQPLLPQSADEQLALADRSFAAKQYRDANQAYSDLAVKFPTSGLTTNAVKLRRLTAVTSQGLDGQMMLKLIPDGTKEYEEGYRQLVLGYAKAKQWTQAHQAADEMRAKFPNGSLVPKTFVDAGLAARDQKNKVEESYFLNTALRSFPNAVEVAQAQFEAAWLDHEGENYAVSSQGFIDHLARYADKDTSNRGKAGYWAARDSQRAGKLAEACALYDAVIYRYGANWYGYLAQDRLTAMKAAGQCSSASAPNANVAAAIANLKKVTVAKETAGPREIERAEKADELSTIGLFDWAIDELNEAKKTADKSPRINLALAKHYRMKGDQVNALLSLAKSYPDYAQMFPEELGREEWDIFYPLTNWPDIKKWGTARGLDPYQVAGIIRQETIFDPNAKSGAAAYGLMQLLLPTAQTMARKYGSTMPNSAQDLFNPSLNIELGTAYMKDQFAKFGRFEYVGVAYNAGPGRVGQWRASLPMEMDEFVEEIPFKETKGYVQGIIRNSAQYRRLYDANGNFKQNVGTKPLRAELDSKPLEEAVAENPDLSVVDDAGE